MPNVVNVSFQSGELTLGGVLHLPNKSGQFPGVAICHPHPRHGGDMRNNIVTALAEDICGAGFGALRFNFRGVGSSEGSYDNGIGETEDAAAALDFLTLHENIDSSRVAIAGYSFGAARALEVCARSNTPQAVASIACGMTTFNQLGVVEILIPKLLVCGDEDHNFPVDQYKFLSKRFGDPKQVETVYGADHFFRGYERQIGELTASFFSKWIGG